MAFTNAQKVQIRFYLGYPFPFQQLNPRLEGAIELVGADASATSMVNDMLVRLMKVYGLDPANPGSVGQVDQVVQSLNRSITTIRRVNHNHMITEVQMVLDGLLERVAHIDAVASGCVSVNFHFVSPLALFFTKR